MIDITMSGVLDSAQFLAAAGAAAEGRARPAAHRLRNAGTGPWPGVIAERKVPPAAQRFRDDDGWPSVAIIAERKRGDLDAQGTGGSRQARSRLW
jgi:hypothetical protein